MLRSHPQRQSKLCSQNKTRSQRGHTGDFLLSMDRVLLCFVPPDVLVLSLIGLASLGSCRLGLILFLMSTVGTPRDCFDRDF